MQRAPFQVSGTAAPAAEARVSGLHGADPLRPPDWGSAISGLTLHLTGSQGSVEVQSTLVFGHDNGTVTGAAAERQLRNSLDPNGFIMDLQLTDIQSEQELWVGVRGWTEPRRGALGSSSAAPAWLGQGGSLVMGQVQGLQLAEPIQFPSAHGGQLDPMEKDSSPCAPS